MRALVRYLVVFLGLFISLGYPTNSRAVDFAAAVNYPVGANPTGVVVGDFNGDGKLDIAVANSVDGSVSILLGNGDGTFKAATVFTAGNGPASIAIGDFNNDGKLDLAVFKAGDGTSVAGAVSILLGKGDGTFQAPQTVTLALTATAMAVADFNLDKKSDLAVSNHDANTGNVTVDILLGKGDGTFQAAKTSPVVPAGTGLFAVADFDNDTKPDLAVLGSGGLAILRGQGDGTFLQGTPLPVAFVPNVVFTADFNGDGKMDLVVKTTTIISTECGVLFRQPCRRITDRIYVFLGNGDGTFQAASLIVTAASTIIINGPTTGLRIIGPPAVGDFNGDGKQDLGYLLAPAANSTSHTLHLLLGKGDGTFVGNFVASAGILASAIGPIAATADLNADKLDDLVILESSTNNIGVVLNTSPASGADLGIQSSGVTPEPVGAARNLTYTAVVRNFGPKNATGVTFTDTLPNGVTFVSATSTQGTCTQSHLVVTCNLGALASPLDTAVTIVVTAPTTAGSITNSMNLTATEPDLVPANNTTTQTSTVVPVYKLTAVLTGNGTGTVTSDAGLDGPIACPTTCTASFLSGTSVNVTANPDAASSLLQSWSGACTGNTNPCTITMDGDKTVTANIVLGKKLTATLAGTGTGSVTSADGALNCASAASPCTGLFLPGASVALTGNPDANSFFGTWGGACSGTTNTCTVTMNADKSVSANFLLGMTLTVTLAGTGAGSVTSNSGGINCAAGPCSATYLPGTVVALTAVPAGTSTFGNWSGGCTGTDPKTCNVTMNVNQAVTATFNPPPDFTVAPSSSSLSVTRGGQGSVVLNFPAQGGFAGTIALTCSVSGPTPMPTCGLSPNSVTPGNSSTLTVNASGLTAALISPSFERAHGLYAAALPFGLLGFVLAAGFDKKRRRMWALCLLLIAIAILPAACGTSSQPPPQPQIFSVTVTATSGAIQHTTVVSVTVN
jgi:uncharacterized repeat protein (TIGR01451 family)